MSSPRLDSPCSTNCGQENCDCDDDQYDLDEADEDSDEDTEDASETEIGKSEEYTEIKEQMYQDKLANLKKQLQQLKDGTHPEYNRLNKKLEQEYTDRIILNSVSKAYLVDRVERDFINEMKAAAKEYEEKKIELRENLIAEYEEKRKMIETERHSLELHGDSMEVKPVMTRKLRRRPNDPLPVPEKRRKPPPAQLNYLLDEKEIELDLKLISRGRAVTPQIRRVPLPSGIGVPPPASQNDSCHEPRIEDGKLRYEKRFFHRGQPVFVEGKDIPRFAANIHNIGTDMIWVKKVSDSSKFRIFLSQLSKKKIHIERRVP
ncbi:UNVERIFIED_CONTAM: hypothetical protein PYX00_005203 [Menopon gallinae]|uniref:Sin3 histone deacetylase corepressor complex component SDS3 n=1 Tax=Menopon gallinae TaxID=328185 RepID=A0AAW2HQC2_9NEOP